MSKLKKYIFPVIRNDEKINLPIMTKPFFDRRVEKRSLSGAKTRLFKEVYRKMAKSDGKFIFFSFLIGFHIMLRLLFSNTLTNDEIITETSNNIPLNGYAAIIPNEYPTQKPLENDDLVMKKSDFASLEVQ